MAVATLTCFCRFPNLSKVHTYTEPPDGENRFACFEHVPYHREIWRCKGCGHFVSQHGVSDVILYEGQYVDAVYDRDGGVLNHFNRIISLAPEKSDNANRVYRVHTFATRYLDAQSRTILDIGSGLCVFLHGMKHLGWIGTAVDRDTRLVEHAKDVVQIQARKCDVMTTDDLGRFDLITLNKVLEHVKDPVAMLQRCHRFLESKGLVYIELPDGECAVTDGFGRQEFFIEHHHIFSHRSTEQLIEAASFRLLQFDCFREPSGKFTISAFLAPSN